MLSAVPSGVLTICQRLSDAGFRAWIVGGCTRDLLLGRDVHDWDVCTQAKPDDVMRLFRRVIPTGAKHGTVTVMNGATGYEVTTLRGEGSYSDGRHPDSVAFVTDIERDLERRDFTVNAIALDPRSGEISDPFGGQEDIKASVLRAVGDPVTRFNEDGLRLIRAARFCATLGFDIEQPTLLAMKQTAKMLRNVSPERIRDEVIKMMASKAPSRAFEVMRSTGLLDFVCPELLPSAGCEQNHYHAFDVWTHTMRVLDECEPNWVLRMAALLHDVGKPSVRDEKDGDYTFYGHEAVGARIACNVLSRLHLPNSGRDFIVHLIRQHLVVYDENWTDAAVRRWTRRVGKDNVDQVLELARADALGKGVDTSQTLDSLLALKERVAKLDLEGMALTTRDLAINGNDLMRELGLAPSRKIGKILEELLERVTDEPDCNERARLLLIAKELAARDDVQSA